MNTVTLDVTRIASILTYKSHNHRTNTYHTIYMQFLREIKRNWNEWISFELRKIIFLNAKLEFLLKLTRVIINLLCKRHKHHKWMWCWWGWYYFKLSVCVICVTTKWFYIHIKLRVWAKYILLICVYWHKSLNKSIFT